MLAIGNQWDNYLKNFLIEKQNVLCLVDGESDDREILDRETIDSLMNYLENIQSKFQDTSTETKVYELELEQFVQKGTVAERLLFAHALYPHLLILQHSKHSKDLKSQALALGSPRHLEQISLLDDALPDGVCNPSGNHQKRSTWCKSCLFTLKMFRELAEHKDGRYSRVTMLDELYDFIDEYFENDFDTTNDRNFATAFLYLTYPKELDPILTGGARTSLVEGFANTLGLQDDPEYQNVLIHGKVADLGMHIHRAIEHIRKKIVETGFHEEKNFLQGANFDFFDEDVRINWDPKFQKKKTRSGHDKTSNLQAVHSPSVSYSSERNSNMLPLNQIFYGPPGTGKTYHTINAALEIIDGKASGDPDKDRERYNQLVEDEQIATVTFHQNYDYTDFIEGIKPLLSEDVGTDGIRYDLVSGVFMSIATKANDNRVASDEDSPEAAVNKAVIDSYAETLERELDEEAPFGLPNTEWYLEEIKRRPNNDYGLKIGAKNRTSQRLKLSYLEMLYPAFKSGEIVSMRGIGATQKSKQAYHGNAKHYWRVLHSIREFEQQNAAKFKQTSAQDHKKNYVLVIDEINRANVSAVFGELITLLEENKRLGNREATQVTLPYSNKAFGVPNNLYIIATMNTADRSIAILDTALRRRFHFTEMMPDPTRVPKDCAGINCQQLLREINRRICELHDREKQIGHSYLMNVKSIQDVATVFKQQVLPLLQEYFFDDWEKIHEVLNGSPLIMKVGSGSNRRFEILPYSSSQWNDKSSYTRIYASNDSTEEQASP